MHRPSEESAMSGPICPDCKGFSIDSEYESTPVSRCRFCGWVGGMLPRKKLSTSSYDEYTERIRKKRTWRSEKALYFLRLYGSPEVGALRSWLRDEGLLELSLTRSEVVQQRKNTYVYIELHAQPSASQRATLEAWDGVERMTLR